MAEFNTFGWGYAIGWPVGVFVCWMWMRNPCKCKRATQAPKE